MLRPNTALRWSGLAFAVSLAGCASAPPASGPAGGVVVREGPAPAYERDGPQANPPPGLIDIPDAQPRIEPVRKGGPNKPYVALGQRYVPITDDRPYVERGLASWYGKKFHGRRTASGEPYDMYAMTAAHPTLPIPSYVRVRNPANGREVIVRINDRGPFHSTRIIDLSYTAALKLGVLRGVAPVEVERITTEDIRTGAWQRGAGGTALAQRAATQKEVPASVATTAPVAPAAPAAPATAAALPAATVAAAASVAAVGSTNASSTSPVTTQPVASSEATDFSPLASSPAPDPAKVAAAEPSAATPSGPGFWVQIGAFRERSGAETFQRRVATEFDWLAPLLAIFDDQSLHRLQAGPYRSRVDAGSALQRIGDALQLKPVIVERW